jgi:hypothetical protein
MSVEWTTPMMKAALQAELDSTVALANSRIIKTEEAREIVARQVRILEILVHGEPKTPMPLRHHD